MDPTLDVAQVRQAINIYHTIAYGGELAPRSMDGFVHGLTDPRASFNTGGRLEVRLGLPRWREARLIAERTHNGSVQYWLDTNDRGDESDPRCDCKRNLEYKTQIETALREAGIPVRSL